MRSMPCYAQVVDELVKHMKHLGFSQISVCKLERKYLKVIPINHDKSQTY